MSLFCPTCHNLLHLGDGSGGSSGMRFGCETCAYVFQIDEKVILKKPLRAKMPEDAVSAKEELTKNPKTPGNTFGNMFLSSCLSTRVQ